MSTDGLAAFRKYSINVSLNENIDQLNGQLHRLLENTQIHFSKKKKLLLHLERRNNQYRQAVGRSDAQNQKKIMMNNDLIRRINQKIMDEDRQEKQQIRYEQEQNNSWSVGGITALVGVAFAGVIIASTLIITMLHNSKNKSF